MCICRILFCCCDRRIRVYSTTTGDLLRELRGHVGKVADFKINPKNHLQVGGQTIDNALINWNPDPPPPTPGLCGAMWGIFMVFEVMVSPWGWGISQDLLSIFIWQSGNEVGIWLVPSLLTVISSRDHRYFDVSGFKFKFPNRWFSHYVIAAMLVDGKQKIAH